MTPTKDFDLELVKAAAKAADDKKAAEITVIEVGSISPVADYFMICTAGNPIQARAIADAVEDALLQAGAPRVKKEGKTESTWILLDAGSVVVHVLLERLRKLYHLEKFWAGGHPVPMDEILPPSD